MINSYESEGDFEKLYPPTKETSENFREKIEKSDSGICTQILGKSILGAPIDIYKIGNGPTNILYVGAHHGAEYITASLLYSFIEKINISRGKLYGFDTELYKRAYTVWVVPKLNPDGVELAVTNEANGPLMQRQMLMADGDFKLWQANARGVDLNHNYSVGFSEYKAIEIKKGIMAGKTLYSGEYPESEPESRALAGFVRAVQLSLVVSLHSQGEEIYAFPSDMKRAKNMAARLSEMLGYKISEPLGSAKYGGFCDYTAKELSIPSFTVEVGKGENPLPKEQFFRIREKTDKALFLLPTML